MHFFLLHVSTFKLYIMAFVKECLNYKDHMFSRIKFLIYAYLCLFPITRASIGTKCNDFCKIRVQKAWITKVMYSQGHNIIKAYSSKKIRFMTSTDLIRNLLLNNKPTNVCFGFKMRVAYSCQCCAYHKNQEKVIHLN